MSILTLLLLLGLVFFSWRWYKDDFLGPWFLFNLAMLVSYCIVLLNWQNWDITIHPEFTLAIVLVTLSWGIGSWGIHKWAAHWNFPKNGKIQEAQKKFLLKFPTTAFILVSGICTVLYFISRMGIYSLLDLQDFSKLLRHIYDEGYHVSFIVNQYLEVAGGIAFICVYKVIGNHMLLHDKLKWQNEYVPILLYLVCILISTDRNKLLRLIIYAVVLYMLFYIFQYKDKKKLLILIAQVLTVGVVSLLVFYLFGRIKLYKSDLGRALGLYGGSGLYNFNLWLHAFHTPYTYGRETFSSVQNLFAAVGIGQPSAISDVYEYIRYWSPNGYSYSTNIYSAMRTYFQDLGWFGLIVFPLLQGAFFQTLYFWTKKRRFGVTWILYSMLIYPIIFFPVLEQFFKRMHLGLMYEVGWVLVFYCIAFKRKEIKDLWIRAQGTSDE